MTAGHRLGEPILVLRGVEKRFGLLPVLQGISLQVARGETACIIGPSGSGKSTLVRCINALVPLSAGSIVLNGREVNDPNLDKLALRRDSFVYRLTLTTGGFVDHTLPLAVRRGQPAEIKLGGWNLPAAAAPL